MEGSPSSSSVASDSDQNQRPSSPGGSGAGKFLADLPSRGLFSSTVISSNPGGMRVYICDHDTTPPEHQQIKTNQQNILIRSLTLKKQKGESSSKDVKGSADGTRKRTAERALDNRASAKKASGGPRQEGSSGRTAERDYHSLTVERLRALLKEKGLSLRGRKDELIARLKSANG